MLLTFHKIGMVDLVNRAVGLGPTSAVVVAADLDDLRAVDDEDLGKPRCGGAGRAPSAPPGASSPITTASRPTSTLRMVAVVPRFRHCPCATGADYGR
jgi:hypothetical protein